MENSKSSDRDILLSIFSDVHKGVYGFRPRGDAFPDQYSDEEIQVLLDRLQERLDEQLQEEDDLPSDAFEDWRDDMDGDFDSGMASAGFGTDEDYGDFGDDGW